MTEDMKAVNQPDERAKEKSLNFNGAAIIDENGAEIPITEDMVQRACEHLNAPKT